MSRRINRYIKLTKSERDERYVQRSFPKPVERPKCAGCAYFSDITVPKWSTGECYVHGWNNTTVVGPDSNCQHFLAKYEPPKRDLGADAFNFHNQRKDQ